MRAWRGEGDREQEIASWCESQDAKGAKRRTVRERRVKTDRDGRREAGESPGDGRRRLRREPATIATLITSRALSSCLRLALASLPERPPLAPTWQCPLPQIPVPPDHSQIPCPSSPTARALPPFHPQRPSSASQASPSHDRRGAAANHRACPISAHA